MRTYTVTLNKLEGDFLIHEFGSFSGKVRAINADHAVNIVAQEFYPRRGEFPNHVLLATHKNGERASMKVGRV